LKVPVKGGQLYLDGDGLALVARLRRVASPALAAVDAPPLYLHLLAVLRRADGLAAVLQAFALAGSLEGKVFRLPAGHFLLVLRLQNFFFFVAKSGWTGVESGVRNAISTKGY
jgi:hypothetical protein